MSETTKDALTNRGRPEMFAETRLYAIYHFRSHKVIPQKVLDACVSERERFQDVAGVWYVLLTDEELGRFLRTVGNARLDIRPYSAAIIVTDETGWGQR